MAEYIQKGAALFICETELQKHLRCGDTVALDIAKRIKALPTDDVAHVTYGRWLDGVINEKFSVCSLCKYPIHVMVGKTNYCPNCGARMDGRYEEKK